MRGETGTITLTATNNGAYSSEGDWSVSVPNDPDPSTICSPTCSSDASNSFQKVLSGTIVFCCYGSGHVTTSYPLVNAVNGDWQSGTSRTLKVNVTPGWGTYPHGSLTFYSKFTMDPGDGTSWLGDPDPNCGPCDTDQQFEKVYSNTIPVYDAHLYLSSTTTDGKGNVGSIGFDSASYALPRDQHVMKGDHMIRAIPPSGYQFKEWLAGGENSIACISCRETTLSITPISGHVSASSVQAVFEPQTFPLTVTVLQPNGREVWQAGAYHTISWQVSGASHHTSDVFWSPDGPNPQYWTSITGCSNLSESYSGCPWFVPPLRTTNAYVNVTVHDTITGAWSSDISDESFSISALFQLNFSSRSVDGLQNVGSTTVNGTTYNLPSIVTLEAGDHSVAANPPSNYGFVSWEYTGQSFPECGTCQETTLHVLGNATLTSVFASSTNYAASFSELGLPSGTSWCLAIGSSPSSCTSGPSQTVTGLSGSMAYTYQNTVSGSDGKTYYCTSDCSGTISHATSVSAKYGVRIPPTLDNCSIIGLPNNLQEVHINEAYTVQCKVTNHDLVSHNYDLSVQQLGTNPPEVPLPNVPDNPLFCPPGTFTAWDLNARTNVLRTSSVRLAAGESKTIQVRLSNSWNWIEPFDFHKLMCDSLWLLVSLPPQSSIPNAISIIDKITSVGLAQYVLRFNLGMTLTGDEGGSYQFPLSLLQRVSLSKATMLGGSILLGTASSIATIAGAFSIIGLPVALAVEVAFFAGQEVVYKLASDPTPEYQTVVAAELPALDNGTRVDRLPFFNTLDKTQQDLYLAAFWHYSRLNAGFQSILRYETARDNDQAHYQVKQLDAAIDYLNKAKQDLATLSSLFMSLAPKDVNATFVRDYFKTKGLPTLERELLSHLGLGQYTESIASTLLALDPAMYGKSDLFAAVASSLGASYANLTATLDSIRSGLTTTWCPTYCLIIVSASVGAVVAVAVMVLARRRRSRSLAVLKPVVT